MTEFGSLKGLKGVITGASSGIGRQMALEFAAGGADLHLHAGHSRALLEEVAQEISHAFGHQVATSLLDLSEVERYEEFVNQAWGACGGIDIWVNNAGVDLLTGGRREWSYARKLQALLDVDVRGTVLLSKLVGERMQKQGRGVILNIGWDQADRGMEGDSGELFAVAKNAIMGFTRSLAVSLAPEVRVNCIAPGWIRTAWGEKASDIWQDRVKRETPLQRWGEPQDIAKLARYLCSPDAAYLTGQVYNANGGAIR
ncbi:MAG: SDR family oxidoreductase [Planctomycetales bacterium]